MRDYVKNAVRSVMGAASDLHVSFSVGVSENPEHGDYATNAALAIAKTLKKNPLEVAEGLARDCADPRWRIEIAPPGFINFFLSDAFLIEAAGNVFAHPDGWGRSEAGGGKIVIVEYFQLNIAKRPHVGHLRSAVIGDAIKRMLLSQGYRAISDTHVGDWGTQFGILLLAYKENGDENMLAAADPFAELETLYRAENERIEKDPGRREQAKQEFAKLEQGDLENRAIWERMVAVSMKKLEASASRLGLFPFDEHRGESFYEDKMALIIEAALQKGVAKKTGDGAIVVDLAADNLDEAVLIKSDGASTYLLRDLATIIYRKKEHNLWENLYVVDVRQSHHFKQLFRVAEMLGIEGAGESAHIEFGFMNLPEGTMSTRKGNAVSLDAVIDEVARRARVAIGEKNPELKNPDTVAEHIGLGALKYFDLSHHRTSDITFRWDDALAFEGNTGPYLQYTHARLKIILRKVGEPALHTIPAVALDPLEHQLLVAALRLPEAIEDALADFTPNTLASYLYKLAQLANEFYHSHPVAQETDAEKRAFRSALVFAVALTLKKGLYLLGIEAPEEM